MPTIVDINKGVADGDISQLEFDGVVYRLIGCSSGDRVLARLYAIHEQGQITLLRNVAVATAAANHALDSVRCVHVTDDTFVILWLDYDTSGGTYELDGAWLSVANIDTTPGFTGLTAIAIDDAGLYDAKQIDAPAGGSEYMLAWTSSGTQTIVRRMVGETFTDFQWSTTVTTTHADRVLAVHGDAAATADNGGVLIAFQDTDNDLCVVPLDYNDGTAASVATLRSDTDAEYTAVGMCISSPSATPELARVALVAEFYEDLTPSASGGEESYVRSLFCIEVDSSDGSAIGNGHVTRNLNLLSKPYSYADAEGDVHVYCGVGYKTCRLDADWQESVGLICDMGLQHWGDTANTIRPRPHANYPHFTINAEPHGSSPEAGSLPIALLDVGRRMNHLSNWVTGPSWLCDIRKSRTVIWPGWSKVETHTKLVVDDPVEYGERLRPGGATVEEITHYLEDPWTVNRDPLDHAQPTFNFHGANPLSLYDHAEVQRELLVAGGTPHLYDGAAIVELGFPWTPEVVEVSGTDGVNLVGPGDYSYIAVYEWTDTKGQLHRSGHGRPYAHTVPAGESHEVTVLVRTMTVGNKEADWLYPRAASIVLAVYRTNPTEADVYRRVYGTDVTGFTPADLPLNDPTAWAVEVIDNVNALAVLLAPPLPYIDGGNADFYTELPPVCPPCAHLVANWQNRAFLASSEERELWYSKENLPTAATGRIAPEFHPTLRFLLDPVLGDLTALQPMDDALVIFTRDGIYSLTGSGPDALGGTTVAADYRLTTHHEGTGCIEPRSVALTPAGIIFQSYKGMYLLDKGFQLDFLSTGAAVEDLIRTAGNVRSGEHLPDRHLVAFVANDAVTDGPIVIKYDYYHRMWSTAKLEPPNTTTWLSSSASGCVWRGNERDASHVVLCQGNLLIERGKDDASAYQDESDVGNAEEVRMDIETGWIGLTGIAGYKRVREIGVQTEVIGSGDALYAEIDIDATGAFSTSSPESHQFGSPGSTAAPAYLRIRPLTPKMSAFRLRLYEPSGVDATENRKIHGIAVHVGRKKGPRKVPDTQQG